MQGAILQVGTAVEQEQQIRYEPRSARQAAMSGFVEIKIAGDERIGQR